MCSNGQNNWVVLNKCVGWIFCSTFIGENACLWKIFKSCLVKKRTWVGFFQSCWYSFFIVFLFKYLHVYIFFISIHFLLIFPFIILRAWRLLSALITKALPRIWKSIPTPYVAATLSGSFWALLRWVKFLKGQYFKTVVEKGLNTLFLIFIVFCKTEILRSSFFLLLTTFSFKNVACKFFQKKYLFYEKPAYI